MKKYILISFFVVSMFGLLSCEDEDPITQSVNYITACNEAEFDIQFTGTNFWDDDLGQWYDLDNTGNQLTNPITGTSQFCRKYIDESTIDPNDPFGSVDTEPTNGSGVTFKINPNGTTDVTLEFTDKLEGGGLVSSTFSLEIRLVDIDSYIVGAYEVENSMNVFIGGSITHTYNAPFTVNFTQIDPINHIYEGTASANVEWWGPITPPVGTSIDFLCDITFSFDKL